MNITGPRTAGYKYKFYFGYYDSLLAPGIRVSVRYLAYFADRGFKDVLLVHFSPSFFLAKNSGKNLKSLITHPYLLPERDINTKDNYIFLRTRLRFKPSLRSVLHSFRIVFEDSSASVGDFY